MKTQIKKFIKSSLLIFVVLSVALLGNAGCATSTPNPLAGWVFCTGKEEANLIAELGDDYHNYIQKLSPQERNHVHDYDIRFFKNESGQHAVKIEVALHGAYYEHVLFYNRDNKRIKVIIYSGGRYSS